MLPLWMGGGTAKCCLDSDDRNMHWMYCPVFLSRKRLMTTMSLMGSSRVEGRPRGV